MRYLIVLFFIVFSFSTEATDLLKSRKYIGFSLSETKNDEAPKLFDIQVSKDDGLWFFKSDKQLTGLYHIVISENEYTLVNLSDGLANGKLEIFNDNQKIADYNFVNGKFDGWQYITRVTWREKSNYSNGVLLENELYEDETQETQSKHYKDGILVNSTKLDVSGSKEVQEFADNKLIRITS